MRVRARGVELGVRFNDGLDSEDFPPGDGTADTEALVTCPYCAERVSMALDPGSGEAQTYVEDCPVCCQPWQVHLHYTGDGAAHVTVLAQSD